MTDHNDSIEAARDEYERSLDALHQDPTKQAYDEMNRLFDALIAVVEREKAASMPCYNHDLNDPYRRRSSYTCNVDWNGSRLVNLCPSCTARAEKADAKEDK